MAELKSRYWYIISLDEIGNTTTFEEPLTEKEARLAFLRQQYADIVDQDFRGSQKILSMACHPDTGED